MKIDFDRLLGILGIVLTIPALIEFFHNENIQEGILFSCLVILVFGYWFYRRWEQKQPLFTYLNVHKELTFQDPAADVALFLTRAKTKANYNGVQQIWFRNINADGDLKNFTVDGQTPFVVQRKAGSYEVCKQFDHPLRSGDVVDVSLTYELHKSFAGNVEGITHATATKTKKLTIRVRFHEQRVGRNLRAFVGRGGQVEEPLSTLRALDNQGIEYELEVEPKQGSYYTIEWNW